MKKLVLLKVFLLFLRANWPGLAVARPASLSQNLVLLKVFNSFLRKSLFYLRFLIVFESQLAWPVKARPASQSKNLVLLKVFNDFFRKSLFYLRFLKVFEGWLARPAAVEARRPVQKPCFT